ncbi:MAG: hypothetical protein U0Y68_08695 [Blastocatellia bacterium]
MTIDVLTADPLANHIPGIRRNNKWPPALPAPVGRLHGKGLYYYHLPFACQSSFVSRTLQPLGED